MEFRIPRIANNVLLVALLISKLYFFREILSSQKNEGRVEFPYTSYPYPTSSIIYILYQSGIFVKLDEPLLIHH